MIHYINLYDYPKWVSHFYNLRDAVKRGYTVDSTKFKSIMRDQYNLDVEVQQYAKIYNVEMDDKNYTAFLLKWS